MSTMKQGVSKSDSFTAIFDFFVGLPVVATLPEFDPDLLVFGIFSVLHTRPLNGLKI